MADPPLIHIDLRSSLDTVSVINNLWQSLHSEIEQIFPQKMLAERKHVSDFENFLKEIDFSLICLERRKSIVKYNCRAGLTLIVYEMKR